MTVKTIIQYLFIRRAACRLGLSRTPATQVYALVSLRQNGEADIVYAGRGLSLAMRFLAPPVVYGDLSNAPVFMATGELNGQDAEKWIDANEEAIVPPGVTPDKIASEFLTFGQKIYAATVLKRVRDKAAETPEKERPFVSLAAPLWNIAKLYSKAIKGPFIIWRVASDGSVLGLVREGRLEKLLNCHVSCDDCSGDAQESAKIIEQYVNRLAQNNSEIPVIAFSPELEFTLPESFSLSLYRLQKPPVIKKVPGFCHEAYANCCFGNDEMNFLPADTVRKVRRSETMMHSLRSAVSTGIIITLALLVLLAGADLALRVIGGSYREPMEKLEAQATIVKVAEARHKGLLKKFKGKIRFSVERSRVTSLVSDLQTVFPENAWAEEISIALVGKDKYQCDIQAVTPASPLIGTTLEILGKVAGMSDARLVSSEQAKLANGTRVMRFKMKSLWHNSVSAGQGKP